ncbi:hypothetical protein REPUB_Repub03eG0054100 [Reevesia pubescens]
MILNWNLRGVGGVEKRGSLRKLVYTLGLNCLLLQETKRKRAWKGEFNNFLWGRCELGWVESLAEGLSGGILTVRQKSFFLDEGQIADGFFTAVWGTLVCFNVKILLVNVYGPCNGAERKVLWEVIANLVSLCNLPCLIAGDFNAVRSSNERMFCLGDSAGMDDFNEFIFSCNLVDIPLIGKKFTWFGREKKRSKLDRFLISEDLFAGFPNLVVKALNKNLSDHVPLVLQWHCRNWGVLLVLQWHYTDLLSFDSDLTVLLRRENFFWELGQGSKLSFWLDCWCSDVPLVVLFPGLFSICLLKEGSVAEFFSNDRWVVPLRRRLFQWECSDLEALLSKLENLKPTSLRGDRLVWKGCKKGILTSKDLYLSFFPVLTSVLKKWWPHLWHLKIPSKVQVFLWQISHDCIPCNAFLIRRHIIPENTFCCRCLTGVEDCFLVIFDCPLSLAVWSVFVSWWGCELPRVSDCTGLLLWSMETFHQECFKNCWHLATSALLHTLWSYRNKVLFDKALWDSDVIFQVIVRSSFAWGNARLKEQISSFSDWSSSPRTSVIFSP